jgi:hypothetical protein
MMSAMPLRGGVGFVHFFAEDHHDQICILLDRSRVVHCNKICKPTCGTWNGEVEHFFFACGLDRHDTVPE